MDDTEYDPVDGRVGSMKRKWFLMIPLLSLITAQLACVQDCMGSTVFVKGHVLNDASEPISDAIVHVYGGRSFEISGFDFKVTSDEEGAFATDSVFRYGCSPFQVEVSADGYQPYSEDFFPPSGEGWSSELPNELVVTLTR
jgi:hypothetical protein